MTSPVEPDPRSSSGNYDRLDRLADEFAERFRRGERPSLKEYTDRYPDLADDIRALFPALVDLEQADEVRQAVAEDPSGSEPPPPAPALAQVGDYRVLREIGHGGMGVVYEAEQVSLGRRVALKILPQHVARDPKMLERFRREARAAARLHHTNIVPVFEVGREGEVCYYAMQFIQGQGLDLVYDELRRLRGRPREHPESGARATGAGIATLADRAAVGQVVQSLLTGRFEDDALPAEVGRAGMFPATLAGAPNPMAATGVFASATVPELDLARTEADSAAGNREKRPTPAPPGLGHAALPSSSTSSSAVSAVMPGGSQISTVDSGRREYARCVVRIGLQAAQALAYAHARGVIHRDIKPSNLLLDTAGVVWITDFGLAKADGDGLTQTGDIIGTLRYMAPERFSGGGDARADVYALGLTLYELLTLEPAFDAADRLRLIEQIKSVDPVRPRLVDRRLPRDLETIILKAIDKDARRRYQTADALAEDLRRFRDDEPILARRATAVERYARWARRNPGVAVLGGVLTAVLVLVTAASLLVAGRMATLAERQRWTADSERVARLAESNARQHEAGLRKQAEQATRDAEAALAEAKVERNRAEENFQRARAVVDQYFTQVSESTLLSVPGLQTLRRDLLGSALSFYEDYLARRGRDPSLRSALAAVHLKAARIHFELGDRAAAEKDYRGALSLYEALAQADSAPEVRNGLAECHYGLAMCGPAGNGRRDALLRSATIREELVAARSTDTRLREDLARSYQALGEGPLAAVPWHPGPAGSAMSDQAQALSPQAAKQVQEALDWFLKARDIAASLVGDHPDDPAYRHDFARNLGEIADCLCKLGRHRDETILRPMAINHARAAYEQAPHEVAYGRLYGRLATKEGINLHSQKRYDESFRSLWQAHQVREKLIRENPSVPDLPRELLTTYLEIVHVATHQPDSSDLVRALRQSCELIEGLPRRGPDQLYILTQLLALRANSAEPSRPHDQDEARRRRDSDLAADALRRAIAGGWGGLNDINALRNNARGYFPSLVARQDVAGMLKELEARLKADALVAQKTNLAPGAAPNPSALAARSARKAQDSDAAHRRLVVDLAASEHAIALIHFETGTTLQKQGDFAAAVSALQKASEQFQAARQALSGDPLLTRQHGISLQFLALALRDSQRPNEALARAREGLAVDESLRDPNPDDLYNLAADCALVAALHDHGATEDREKLAARAVRYLRRAIESDPDRFLPQVSADHNLDPLRSRADFGALMADASFPRDPFVPADAPVSPPRPITNSIGMKLVLIPSGEFTMGSPDTDKDAQDIEKPQHRVRITRPFFLGATEVTVGQFRRVVETAGYKTEAERDANGGTGWNAATGNYDRGPQYTWRNPGFPQTDEHPVVNVSWNDAIAFCNMLSDREGLTREDGYRLPTEAEWEYACRSGTTGSYGSGNDPETLAQVGNVADGTFRARYPTWNFATMAARDGTINTAPVGQFRPNTFHLYDMYGNVYEWCVDGFARNYYGQSPAADPAGLLGASEHVVRGGAWHSRPSSARPASRYWHTPEYRHNGLGFRVARVQSRSTTDLASLGDGPKPQVAVIRPDPIAPADGLGGTGRSRAESEAWGAGLRSSILAQFHFDGDARDSSGHGHQFSLRNTEFKDNALYLNGKYGGYHATCPTPTLNYDAFTVALRFKAESFGGKKLTLLVGGTSHRWFSLSRSPDGALLVGLNNRRFEHKVKDTRIDANQWYDIVCGVDLIKRDIAVFLNGTKVDEIPVPKDFELAVVKSDWKDSDKAWTFTNYAIGGAFHGVIDELIIYDKMLTPDEFPRVASLVRSGSSGNSPSSPAAAPGPEPLGSLKGVDRSNNEPAAPLRKEVNRQDEAGKNRAKLVGQTAAPLAVEAWVNGSLLTDLDLKGKVVLLDFWAVWCGPCIATFPHLREWNEKYADKGLVMIGLTDYYNYDWDEKAGRPTRSAGEVAPEKEQAMLVEFAAQHKLTHRFGIQKEHSLSKYYGVTGIPQVVVIDREGVVRLIRVGSGEANAKDIGELLETLLAPGEP